METYFVVRDTYHPEEDLKRNWSSFVGGSEFGELSFVRWETKEKAIEAYEKYTMQTCNVDFRFHPAFNSFAQVHYEGLGAWTLESESLEEAIEEAKNMEAGLATTLEKGNGHFFAEDVVSFHKVYEGRYIFEIKA